MHTRHEPNDLPDRMWSELRDAAHVAAALAYAPYSNYQVGAAALTDAGVVVTGCNVENASYGLTLCAECEVVTAAAKSRQRLVAVVIVHGQNELIAPCGRCRQLLSEHARPGCEVLLPGGVVTIEELLPHAFGPLALDPSPARHEQL